jgi:hypothetical protein
MDTQVFDDGSTLTYDEVSGYYYSTPGASDGINAALSGFNPQTANPSAATWDQVLQRGFARTIDAITRPLELQNAQPVLQQPAFVRWNTGTGAQGVGLSQQGLLLLALAAVAVYALAK